MRISCISGTGREGIEGDEAGREEIEGDGQALGKRIVLKSVS